jgi:CBS domain-containing protein
MTRDVIIVTPELALATAWRVMTREHIRHLPVVRAGALVGMLSDRDVLARGTIAKDGSLHVEPHIIVEDAMTATPRVPPHRGRARLRLRPTRRGRLL